jgi:photosystem II stability/assembly factor-like uncharacterized protein
LAAVQDGGVYISTDSGGTWANANAPGTNWSGIAISADGTSLAATANGAIYISTNSGASWGHPATPLVNVVVTGSFVTSVTSTNTGGGVDINDYTNSYAGAYVPAVSNVPVDITLGVQVAGAKVAGTNTAAYSTALSAALPGSGLAGVLSLNPAVAGIWGTNNLAAGTVISSTNASKTFVDQANIPGVTNPLQFLMEASNFVNVIRVQEPEASVTISNLLEIRTVDSAAPQAWAAVVSAPGLGRLVAAVKQGSGNGGYIYYSTNWGVTWVAAGAPSANWSALASSADGSKLVAAANGGLIYTSTNAGAAWVASNRGLSAQNWAAVASSADGSRLVAAVRNGLVYTSTNSGADWTAGSVPVNSWTAVASSPDGNTLLALAQAGSPSYRSTDGGLTWTVISAPVNFWQGLASSADGNELLAAPLSGYLYRSTNSGATWQQLNTVEAVITNLFVVSTVITNQTTHKAGTNVLFSAAWADTNLVNTEDINLGSETGISVVGTNVVGTNMVTVTASLGLTLFGTNIFAFSPVTTNLLGASVLGAGAKISSTGITNMFLNNPDIPGFPGFADLTGLVITNGLALADTDVFTNIASTNLSGMSVIVTDELGVNVYVTAAPQQWSAVASSADGTVLAAAANDGDIYTSTNSGDTWSVTGVPDTNLLAIAVSAGGRTIVALSGGGLLYTSSDSGVTWAGTNVGSGAESLFGAVAASADGSELVAAMYDGFIYLGQATPTPALQISAAGHNVILAWPAGSANFSLQQKSDVSATAAWVDLPATPVVTNGQNQVVLPMSTGQSLYRLKRQ